MLSLTTGGPLEAYLPGGFNGDINGILRPIQRGMLEFVCFDVLAPNIIYGPAHLKEEQRRILLHIYGKRLENTAREQPVDVGSF